METSTTMTSYEDRLNRVVDYIHGHLEEDIGMDRLAEVACLSPYHWHRIYTAMRGETITQTVRRLRLQRAADHLANTAMPVRQVAARAGYSTVEAFGRAFKETYGRAPADYRERGSHALFKAASAAADADGFAVTLDSAPAAHCAAVAHTGPYIQIDRAMGTLFANLADQQLLKPDSRMIGVYFDDPDAMPVDELRAMACSPVAPAVPLAPPLVSAELRAGAYARLRYKGPYADMRGAYRWLFGVWLPRSSREAADAPVLEEYLNNPRDVAPSELLTDIYLPLRENP